MIRTYIIVLLYGIVGIQILLGQDASPISLHGKVMSSRDNVSLEGTRISNPRGKVMAISVSAGNFNIKTDSRVEGLIFRHVGYHTKYISLDTLDHGAPLTVILDPEVNTIEDVVVSTGYQSLRPNEVTGAVQLLDNNMLQQQIGTNILQRINNVSTAVRFDNHPIKNTDLQKTNVSIRGLSTINGYLDPLIVLDGFIYEGDISNIDPNSIDNITILKDAAATSIWGARAGNGVIVMTSKKGTKGQKTSVSFNSTVSISALPDLYDIYQPSNADYIQVEEMLFKNGYYDRQLSRTPYQAVTPVIDIFQLRKQQLISSQDSMLAIRQLMESDGRKAYVEDFFVKPVTGQYSLNIGGNSELHSYGLGIGYTSQRQENDNGSKKINVLLSNTFRPFQKLRLDMSLIFTNQKDRSGMAPYSSLKHGGKTVPYGKYRDDNGKALPFDVAFRRSYVETFLDGYMLDWNYYPLEDHRYSGSVTNLIEFYPTVNLSYKLFSFMDFNIGGQYQYQRKGFLKIDEVDSYYARTMINQFTEVNTSNGTVKYIVPMGGIRNTSNTDGSSYTFRGQLNVDKQWNQHRIVGIVGGEMRENMTKGEEFTVYGYTENPLQTVPVDHATQYLVLPSYGYSRIVGDPKYRQLQNRFVSLYTNWSYLFAGRYGLSGSIRRDGANIFGAMTNDKWKPFWSIGALWNATEESFFPTEALSLLKFRVTYGFSGNVDLRKTPLPIASTLSGAHTNYPALIIGALNDPSLRWEKVGTVNFGMDFALKTGRISGNIDYYVKNGADLYGLDAYDYTVWGMQRTITKNTAQMRGKGWDIMLNSRNLNGGFAWETSLLFSYNKNKAVKYYSQGYLGATSFLHDGHTVTPVEGRPLNGVAGWKWAGLDEQGMPMGFLNGEPSTDYDAIRAEVTEQGENAENIIFLGSVKPQVFGSLINTFRWQNVSLSFNISFKGDYYFKKPTTSYSSFFDRGTAYPDFEERWQEPGDEARTNVPAMVYPVNNKRDNFYSWSEINILKGDHLRLEYVNISYRPEITFIKKLTSLEIYANASNLGLLWTRNGERIDPEFTYRIKPQRVYAVGLKVDF